MINILVCFTSVPDLDLLSEDDWSSGCQSGKIDTSFLKCGLNSFDESALELVSRFTDEAVHAGISSQRTAVTIGRENNDQILKTLAAIGFDHTDRICSDNDDNLDAELASALLCTYINENGPFDLIVLGSQSSLGNSKKTPFLLSERLGYHCVSQVTEIHPQTNDFCEITRDIDGAKCKEKVYLPLLITIGTAASTYLRVPTLRERMKVKPENIKQINMSDLLPTEGIQKEASVSLVSMRPVNNKRIPVVLSGSPDEQAKILYEKYLNQNH